MGRTKNATRNIIWGLINKCIVLLLPFIKRTILIRVLGADFLGLDSLFTSILQMLNITESGFGTAIVFSLYDPIARKDKDKICAIMNLYKRIYRVVGMIILTLGICIMPFLPKLIKDELPAGVNLYVLYFIFLIDTVLGYWLFAYKRALITAHQRGDIISNVNSLISICKTAVQIGLVVGFHNYYLYILVMPFVTILENIYLNYVTKNKYAQYQSAGDIDDGEKRNLFKRVKGLFIQQICTTSRNSMDNIIISSFVGLNMVSIYGNYYCIMSSVHVMLACFADSIAAGVGEEIAVESKEKNHKNMLKFNFMYMWLAGIATTSLVCLYQPFMELWMGEKYLLPNSTMVAICIYFYSLCIGDIRYLYMIGAGLWWEGRYRSLIEALMNIILNIVLGKILGIFGVILATIISIWTINFCYGSMIVYKYYFQNGKLFVYFKKQILYAFSTFIVVVTAYNLCLLVNCNSIVNIIVRLFICLVIPNVEFYLLYHRQPEFRMALELVKRIIKK